MKLSDLPTIKLPIPFADSAVAPYIHEIPVASQIGITDGAASLETGFVPDNFIAPGAGGVPPFGNDVNGILFEISGWTRWLNAGGAIFPYDSAFAIEIGGYPAGALCGGTGGFFISRIDDNLSVPGADTNWQAFGLGNSGVNAGSYANANITVLPDGRISVAANGTLPTRTTYGSGSGTFTTPAGARQLRVRMVAGGGGGRGATNGGQGGTTSFGAFTCIGGGGGTAGSPGAGGTGGAGSALRFNGSDGHMAPQLSSGSLSPGGHGGTSMFGGSGTSNSDGYNGSGGGGLTATGGGSITGGHGGASGEGAEFIIDSPAASYAYSVGTRGTAGSGGGGQGGFGLIIIDVIY